MEVIFFNIVRNILLSFFAVNEWNDPLSIIDCQTTSFLLVHYAVFCFNYYRKRRRCTAVVKDLTQCTSS